MKQMDSLMKKVQRDIQKLMSPTLYKPKKKDMNYMQAARFHSLKPFGNYDKDNHLNLFDCKPFDKKRHGYLPALPHPGKDLSTVKWIWDPTSSETMYYDPMKNKRGVFPFGKTTFNMRKPELKRGNEKISDEILVFNPGGSVAECPSARRGLCPTYIQTDCYARPPELGQGCEYPHALEFRARNRAEFRHHDANAYVKEMIRTKQAARVKKTHGTRFSEAGDIKEQWEIDQLADIARGVKKEGMFLYGYTKARTDEVTGKPFDLSRVPDNMTINFGPGRKMEGQNRFIPIPEEQLYDKVRSGLKEDERLCIPGRDKCGYNEEGACEECIDRGPHGQGKDIYTIRRQKGVKHSTYYERFKQAEADYEASRK